MDSTIINLCRKQIIDAASLLAFIEVETGGHGFDDTTHKLLIQFEPVWFRRKAPYAPSGRWSVNKVEVQQKEWKAFNDAFRINPDAAMQSTSIGLGQIMGFNFKRLGYKSVGAMWDDAKSGLGAQVNQMVRYIDTDSNLKVAILNQDWHMVAKIYNGPDYLQLAKHYHRVPYDISMRAAYIKYSKIVKQ